jgi:hypothetical protein
MSPQSVDDLSPLELAVANACRKVSNSGKRITRDTTVNLDLGIAGDDGDELAGEIISSTGLAIGADLDFSRYFGTEVSIVLLPLLLLFNRRAWRSVEPLTIGQLAGSLREDPLLAKQQLDSLNAFWHRNWTLPDQGSSSTSQ